MMMAIIIPGVYSTASGNIFCSIELSSFNNKNEMDFIVLLLKDFNLMQLQTWSSMLYRKLSAQK